jgi:hypothetical protein
MLLTRYDLLAIANDASMALLNRKAIWWSRDFGDKLPAHVVCSLIRGMAQPSRRARLSRSAWRRWTTPADWVDWIKAKEWERWGR